ncbi:YkoP family protein [Halobacillus sp. MO56]
MRQYIVDIWTLFDPIYYRIARLTYIKPNNTTIKNVFRVRIADYKGEMVILKDGTRIQKHDKVLKIHLHNIRLINEMRKMDNEIHKAMHIYKSVRESLPDLADYIRKHQQNSKITGVMGITAIHKGCHRLGFETAAITNPYYRFMKFLSFIAISTLCMRPPSLGYLKNHQPNYIFISKEQLQNRYLNKIDTN